MIDILIDLQKKGELIKLVRGGVMSTKVLSHVEIFLEYDKRIKLGGKSADIIFDISEIFKVSQRTIYDVIKKYK